MLHDAHGVSGFVCLFACLFIYLPYAIPRDPNTKNLFLSSLGSHQENNTLSAKSDLCQLVLMRRVSVV